MLVALLLIGVLCVQIVIGTLMVRFMRELRAMRLRTLGQAAMTRPGYLARFAQVDATEIPGEDLAW